MDTLYTYHGTAGYKHRVPWIHFTLTTGLLDTNTESHGYTLHLPWDCWIYTQSLVDTLYTYRGTAGYKHRVSWIHFTLSMGLLDTNAESRGYTLHLPLRLLDTNTESRGYTLHLPWDGWIQTKSLMDTLYTYCGTAGYKRRVSWIHFTLNVGLLGTNTESHGYTLHLLWDCWIQTQSLVDTLYTYHGTAGYIRRVSWMHCSRYVIFIIKS